MTDQKMQQYVLYEKKSGRVVASGTSFHIDRMETDDIGVISDQFVDDVRLVYVRNGKVMLMPDKPSVFHQFDYVRSAWVFDSDSAWGDVRMKRNALLQQTDWTQLPDVPSSTKQTWADYRQALRDVTNQPDPINITWPTPPSN